MKKWAEIIKNKGIKVAVKDMHNPLFWVQKQKKEQDFEAQLADSNFNWQKLQNLISTMSPQQYQSFLATPYVERFINKFYTSDAEFRKLPSVRNKVKAELYIVRSLEKIDTIVSKLTNPMIRNYLDRAKKALNNTPPETQKAYEYVSAAQQFFDTQSFSMDSSEAVLATGLTALVGSLREAAMYYAMYREGMTKILIDIGTRNKIYYNTMQRSTQNFLDDNPDSFKSYN
jgi:hypothetical protein